MELRIKDLRLRGSFFTLYPAARENGVNDSMMAYLYTAIYESLGLLDDFEKAEAIKAENPAIPTLVPMEYFENSTEHSVEDLLKAELVSQEGTNIALTEKAIRILESAAEKQKQLDEEGFYFCPCAMF